jgi:hypothetical protein
VGKLKPLLGQPPPVHFRPSRLAAKTTIMPQQEAAHRLLGPDGIVLRAASRADEIAYRLVRFVRHQIAVSSPARSSRARVIASRRSVLTWSPGRRGIIEGR